MTATAFAKDKQPSNVNQPKQKKDDAPVANMRWLWRYLVQYRRQSLIAIFAGLFGGVTFALEPYIVGIVIDDIVERGVNMGFITQNVILLLLLAAFTVAMFFIQRNYSGIIAYSVHYDMRRDLFAHMVTQDDEFYRQNPTGDLISRMFSDLDWVWRLLAIAFSRLGNAISGLVIAFVLLATIDLRLTLLVFVVLSISTYFQIRAGVILISVMERVQDQAGVMSALVQDTASGIQTIKTFGREADANQAFYKENVEYRKRWLHFKRRNEPVGMIPQMISYLTQAIVVFVGGMMTINGDITIGNFAQFLLYLGLISRVLLMMGMTYQRFMQTRGTLKRITPLLQEPRIKNAAHAKAMSSANGDIRFEGVSLKEGDAWLLRDIDLHIPSGKVMALVGATGSGKTILVNLLSRVTDADAGRVLIDGKDVRELQLEDLRDTVAYVPQETFLFSQPLHENVRMGHSEISDDELDRAIHISRVSNDLPQMPEGLETLVGEKGVMLSGGQKQRVAIARAIARDPAILVLDDALSSVDTQTAAEILNDMRQVLNTRTSILIAHRIATVKDADFIVVMDEGRIIEQGSHNELIAQNGLYASMVEREAQQESEALDS